MVAASSDVGLSQKRDQESDAPKCSATQEDSPSVLPVGVAHRPTRVLVQLDGTGGVSSSEEESEENDESSDVSVVVDESVGVECVCVVLCCSVCMCVCVAMSVATVNGKSQVCVWPTWKLYLCNHFQYYTVVHSMQMCALYNFFELHNISYFGNQKLDLTNIRPMLG